MQTFDARLRDGHMFDLPRNRLDAMIATVAGPYPHMVPVLQAVRDHSLRLMFVQQGRKRIKLRPDHASRPFLSIVYDDGDLCLGPGGFHKSTLRQLLSGVKTVAVISCAATTELYSQMTALPILLGASAMIIETRPEQEIAWVEFVRAITPQPFIVWATVKGGRA